VCEAEGQLVFGMMDHQTSVHVRESFYGVAIRFIDAAKPYPRDAPELDVMSCRDPAEPDR
jgi:hypothetical protein